MQFTFSNRDDIRRYFRGTFLKFQEFGDTLFYIEDVTNGTVVGKDDQDNDFVLYLDDARPYEVNFVLPHKAVYQHGRGCTLISRIPARQYRRGICVDNTQIMRLSDKQLYDVNFANLTAFVQKPVYHSLKKAIHGKNSLISVAVTPRFFFEKRTSQLYLLQTAVATYDRERKEFTCISLFKEELNDLIAQDPWEVTVK